MKIIYYKPHLRRLLDNIMPLRNDEWDLVETVFEGRIYNKNEIITHAGEIENYMYFLVHGAVRSFHKALDQEYTMGFKTAPNAFSCYTSFIKREPSKTSYIAMTKVVAFRLSYDNMEMLYDTIPRVEKLSRIFLQLAFVEKEIKEFNLQTKSATDFYKELCLQFPELVKIVPQKHIASYMGIAPESLSRIKKQLKNNKDIISHNE